ncbi:caspase family protein [Halorubrum sp. JWXQ-INN 858]|uniref:caspase family protein n=1 Tax=Halorubrum sp. JWXQ-INN 858 TaxID=2690782 RepID=UPI00135C9DDC|nr:caspase family protein [Halorubrum sp. JWXQ-INN 858]MWV66031.1 caspase family protein [Halorubrum sp. JWXQ-INN 858]
MSIEIVPSEAHDGLTVTDHIEHTQFVLYTDRPVDPTPDDADAHYFPVGASVSVETGVIEIPRLAAVEARSGDGTLVTRGDDYSLPTGEYRVGIDPAPTKLYASFRSAFSVTTTDRTTRIEFDGPRSVSLGFRSLHQVPAGTIGTPTDPESLMRAVSLFGSALQTTSPERSFPTLRGHPPLLEPADELSVPEHVTPPDSGVRIVVPPEYRSLYPVVPLAYYFAAEVVPGEHPRITGDGWSHSLEPDLERRAAELLRRSFHLDCITRTEGFYPIDLHERAATDLDLDWAALYDAPLAERLGEHAAVPFERVEPELPQWTLTTDVRPAAENVEMLPFIAGELSLVRSPETVRRPGESDGERTAGFLRAPEPGAGEFFRGGTGLEASAAEGAGLARGAARRGVHGFIPDDADFVRPEPVETVEHAWVGDGVPLGANKATLDAYRSRLEVGPVEQSRISVLVVCNDELMREEGDVAELYGLRDIVQFDIEVRYDLTREELRTTLGADVDFLHYIGHVDERGMQCPDGFLDLREGTFDVGVDAFLLNACQSYEQGAALIDRGSRGGIVTLTDVPNSPATRLGRIIARLMNSGFNLRTALHVAQRELITGNQYIVVGDGGTTICQNRSGVALVIDSKRADEDRWDVIADAFPNGPYGIGTMTYLNLSSTDTNYYVPAEMRVEGVPRSEFLDFLNLETVPIFVDGDLAWTDELSLD